MADTPEVQNQALNGGSDALEVESEDAPTGRYAGFLKAFADDDDTTSQPDEDTEEDESEEDEEEPADDGEARDAQNLANPAPESDEDEANAEELIFDKYKTIEEAKKGFKSSQAEAGRLARENAELKRQLEEKNSSANVSKKGETPSEETPEELTDDQLLEKLVENPKEFVRLIKEEAKAEALKELEPDLQSVRETNQTKALEKELTPIFDKYSEMPEGFTFDDFMNAEGGEAAVYLKTQADALHAGEIDQKAYLERVSTKALEAEYIRTISPKAIAAAQGKAKAKDKAKAEKIIKKAEKGAAASTANAKTIDTVPIVRGRRGSFDAAFDEFEQANKK